MVVPAAAADSCLISSLSLATSLPPSNMGGGRISLLGTRDEPGDSVEGSVARGWKLGCDWRAQISITVLHTQSRQ